MTNLCPKFGIALTQWPQAADFQISLQPKFKGHWASLGSYSFNKSFNRVVTLKMLKSLNLWGARYL